MCKASRIAASTFSEGPYEFSFRLKIIGALGGTLPARPAFSRSVAEAPKFPRVRLFPNESSASEGIAAVAAAPRPIARRRFLREMGTLHLDIVVDNREAFQGQV